MSPFENLRPLSADLADKGNISVKALEVSPELGCGALRTWLEVGVIRYLEQRIKLPPLTGASAIEQSIDSLFDLGTISQQQRNQFHKIRMDGNAAAHGRTIEPSTAHSNFQHAAAIGDWLLAQPAQIEVAARGSPDLERFFHFRKYRALGDTTW